MNTIERGELEIRYSWSVGDRASYWYPGEMAHAENIQIFWRGRKLENVSYKSLDRLSEEIAACHR